MGVDLDTFEPMPNVNGQTTYGGYSGMAIKPIGLRCVAQIRQNSNLPILGTGGISNWRDAAEFMCVGALFCLVIFHGSLLNLCKV